MPTPILPQSSARSATKVSSLKSRATTAPPKNRRTIRRRGRARGDLDSDDEIEREAVTDSDSDGDHSSSSQSATDDSDTEPASEDVITHDRAHLPTPRNSKSPESVVNDGVPKVNGVVPSFFAPSADWSEMVTDEKLNGPAELPVIEFAEFDDRAIPQNGPSRKSKKAGKAKRSSESRPAVVEPAHEEPVSSPARGISTEVEANTPPANRVSSQSARQAYQHKLDTDPSFVPTIGNFWGHDDRLIDSELRSLSGWWRGRGRGRGRGFASRGRGGFGGTQSRGGEEATASNMEDLPPIERAWTHDGFEDMKRKEEKRRAEYQAARNEQGSPKRGGAVTGRGGFVGGRGRGGFGRGGFASPTLARNLSPFGYPGRVRFASKPELFWTTQHEAFLFFDPAVKPRPGYCPTYQIKMPGKEVKVAKGPPLSRNYAKASTSKAMSEGSEAGDRRFVVCLPKRPGKERAVVIEGESQHVQNGEAVAEELPIAAISSKTESVQQSAVAVETATVSSTAEVISNIVPEPTVRSQLEQLSVQPQAPDPERQAKMEEAVLRNPIVEVAPMPEGPVASERPALHPLQTGFTSPPLLPVAQPLAQPSPAFGSPYGYHPQLPPGVAYNQHGMPFELATGHPVYFQPPTMYNPRPLMPAHYNPTVNFLPSHMHHPSAVSPDFHAHQSSSHTPPMNGFIDPATGTPIFSFPRQTSRIEIRAPSEESSKSKSAPRTSSGLRTTAPTFQPTRPAPPSGQGYYQQSTSSDNGGSSYENTNGQTPLDDPSQAGMPGMMAYPSYQQPYYYPEHYGYPQYVDMSQGGQYDMYNMDQAPQGTVYY